MSRLILILFIFILSPSYLFAQEQEDIDLTLGLYLDIFYGYDLNQPTTETRLPYIYHHNRHNQFNLNHGIIYFNGDHDRFRFNIGLQTGTYVLDNFASEPDVLKLLATANAGFTLDKNREWWLDVGIFGKSWIGFESTLAYENINVGHNLISENVPYYFSGARLTKNIRNGSIALIVTNGWQRIKPVVGNSLPGFGTQIEFFVSERFDFNWSTFTGTDDPDDQRRIRFFNNFYGTLNLSERLKLIAGFDLGIQQTAKNSSSWNNWYGFSVVGGYRINEDWSTGARIEYYHDPNEAIVESINPQAGYKTSGFSVNLDYLLLDMFQLRTEARWFHSPDEIYPISDGSLKSNNFFLLVAVMMNFEKGL